MPKVRFRSLLTKNTSSACLEVDVVRVWPNSAKSIAVAITLSSPQACLCAYLAVVDSVCNDFVWRTLPQRSALGY